MTPAQIYQGWYLWLIVGGATVIAAAILLVIIIGLAMRIARLAAKALAVVQEIEDNTGAIWQLNATNHVANNLLEGAHAIDGNAAALDFVIEKDYPARGEAA